MSTVFFFFFFFSCPLLRCIQTCSVPPPPHTHSTRVPQAQVGDLTRALEVSQWSLSQSRSSMPGEEVFGTPIGGHATTRTAPIESDEVGGDLSFGSDFGGPYGDAYAYYNPEAVAATSTPNVSAAPHTPNRRDGGDSIEQFGTPAGSSFLGSPLGMSALGLGSISSFSPSPSPSRRSGGSSGGGGLDDSRIDTHDLRLKV